MFASPLYRLECAKGNSTFPLLQRNTRRPRWLFCSNRQEKPSGFFVCGRVVVQSVSRLMKYLINKTARVEDKKFLDWISVFVPIVSETKFAINPRSHFNRYERGQSHELRVKNKWQNFFSSTCLRMILLNLKGTNVGECSLV